MTRIWNTHEIEREIDSLQNQINAKMKQFVEVAAYYASDRENQTALDNFIKIDNEIFEMKTKLLSLQDEYWFAQHLGLGCI